VVLPTGIIEEAVGLIRDGLIFGLIRTWKLLVGLADAWLFELTDHVTAARVGLPAVIDVGLIIERKLLVGLADALGDIASETLLVLGTAVEPLAVGDDITIVAG